MASGQWREYRKTIIDFRDQMAAHHDLNATVLKYPHFDTALAAADFMYGKLLERVDGDPGHELASQGLLKWADHVSQHMRPVVTRSFSASAEMLQKAPTVARGSRRGPANSSLLAPGQSIANRSYAQSSTEESSLRKGRIAALVVAGMAFAAQGQVSVTGGRYMNARYAFAIDYPAELIPLEEAPNGDGRAFESADGKVRVTASGSLRMPETESYCDAKTVLAREHPQSRVSYEFQKGSASVASLLDADTVHYVRIHKASDRCITFRAEYPSSRKDQMDPLVARMSTSLRVAARGAW